MPAMAMGQGVEGVLERGTSHSALFVVSPESGDLVIARVNERISVYRYLEGPSNGFLTVDDPRLPAVELSPSAELIGVAIFLIRDLRR